MEITARTFEEDEKGLELVLTLTATPEEVDKAIDKYFKELNKNEVPGFRKGKAPRNVLENGVGGHEQAYTGAAEVMMNELAFKVIDDDDVIFLSDPEFNVDGIMEDHKPYQFQVSGMVAPTMKLTSYEPVTIEMPPDEATDSEIDNHIENLREYYHSFEDITDPDHEAKMGEFASLVVTCSTSDGKPIRGLYEVERLIGLGKGTMPASFDEHIVGSKVGDTLAFDFEAKGEKIAPEFGDGNLHAEVEVKGFRKCILPELDDAFAQRLGSENVEILRKSVAAALNEDKAKHLPQLMEDRAVAVLSERLDGQIPRYYLDFVGQGVSQEYIKKLEKEGTSIQEWILHNNVKREDIREQIEGMAYHRAACDLALEALSAELGLEVTEEEVDREFAVVDNGDEVRKEWEGQNRMADLRKLIRHTKATRWLVDTAEVIVVEDD